MSPLVQIIVAAAVISLLMATLWAVQRRAGNAGTVDVAWAGTIGLAAVFFAATGSGDATSRWLAAVLAAVWSGRLTWYLFGRVVGHPEEGRYATLRAKWGDDAQRRFFVFFQIQAAAALFFALPFLVLANRVHDGLSWLDFVGIAVWAIGIVGVALSDRQLAVYRQRPENRGKTCRAGLWRYSRHPNYFFEWLHWCAYAPLVIHAPGGWLAVLVPLVLLYFFFFVTGIPPTESQALASRGDDYRSYQRSTSVFVPWFPKRESP